MSSSTDLDQLFIDGVPLIDVRAPVEFARGAFPMACNLPILNDDERQQVGTRYRQSGSEDARSLGHQLVSGAVRDRRLAGWIEFLDEHPNAHLYCFRGGDRSRIACQWLSEAGHPVPRIDGGYKRMRRHLLQVFDDLPKLMVVAGKTGTGKTGFLKPFSQAIDLEGIACHRGSAFGGRIQPQPSQIDFENSLSIEFLRRRNEAFVLLEDEGRLIGRTHVPTRLQEKMKAAPLLLIEETVSERAQRIFDEYIYQQWHEYEAAFSDEAFERFCQYLLAAVDAIRKRLGNVAHQEIRDLMEIALQHQEASGDQQAHLVWIERLLVDYYDPMYEYQLSKKLHRVIARGSHRQLCEWLRERDAAS